MSTKLHSGLKRTLAWLLTAAMLAQGCFVVSADDFSSEPVAAQLRHFLMVQMHRMTQTMQIMNQVILILLMVNSTVILAFISRPILSAAFDICSDAILQITVRLQ